jgi:hypothetical protein
MGRKKGYSGRKFKGLATYPFREPSETWDRTNEIATSLFKPVKPTPDRPLHDIFMQQYRI